MKIGFVIITFNPENGLLFEVLKSIENQSDLVVVIDNGSHSSSDLDWLLDLNFVHLIKLDQNLGIASASNFGARYLKELEFDRVVFCDQDTIFPVDYREKVMNAVSIVSRGIIVPQFYDINKNATAVFQAPDAPLKNFEVGDELTHVLHGIASGLCVDLISFFECGGFDDNLFIDWVDFEFCWRAAHYGVPTYCLGSLIVHHRLGDANMVFMGRSVASRSPMRLFFMVRNEIYLGIFGLYTPLALRPLMVFRALRRALVMPFLFGADRGEYLRMAAKGLVHGLCRKLGPLVR